MARSFSGSKNIVIVLWISSEIGFYSASRWCRYAIYLLSKEYTGCITFVQSERGIFLINLLIACTACSLLIAIDSINNAVGGQCPPYNFPNLFICSKRFYNSYN